MDIHLRLQERENPSPANSPTSNGSNSSSNNGAVVHHQIPTPKPISRSEISPYPTTFVQADTSNFKQVVQMLTGSSETAKQASNSKPTHQDPSSSSSSSSKIPPIKTAPKKQGFKLYERRNKLKNNFMINTFVSGFGQSSAFSPRNHEILSPSLLDFPKLTLSSPVTPLNEDPFNKASPFGTSSSEEEKAIAEKGFYLHPSPRTLTPRDSEPQLLPLFPVESPRVSGSSS